MHTLTIIDCINQYNFFLTIMININHLFIILENLNVLLNLYQVKKLDYSYDLIF